jgi:hypothetical protein
LQEIRPDKEKTPDKIDGIVALDMAIDRGIIRQPLVPPSVYLERGVRTLGA